MLSPGVYLSASTANNPQRIIIKEKTLVTIVENHSVNFVVAMIDTQTFVLTHKDSVKQVQ